MKRKKNQKIKQKYTQRKCRRSVRVNEMRENKVLFDFLFLFFVSIFCYCCCWLIVTISACIFVFIYLIIKTVCLRIRSHSVTLSLALHGRCHYILWKDFFIFFVDFRSDCRCVLSSIENRTRSEKKIRKN